jgi:uncharacterized membrane-anchored protein
MVGMNPQVFHGCFLASILCLAIVGGFVIGTSGCPMQYSSSFCGSNGQYVAGFVILMIMIAVFIVWVVISIVKKIPCNCSEIEE